MKNWLKKNKIKGFTLVELLAVIVILAIILVIAVPKVMNVIDDSKKATLESTAKMIANSAEKQKVQNTILGKTDTITCDSVVKINDADYERCIIEFDNNGNALVSIKGKGKFANLNVCAGDKTNATANNAACTVLYGRASTYIEKLEAFNGNENHLEKKSVEYEGTIYDAGIRYRGSNPNNYVYFNCEDTYNSIVYGNEGYDYKNACEIWRIIGVFEVDNGKGNIEKRIKLINTASTFSAPWDISASDENNGQGINQWGESTYEDGTAYEGADLMQLLNGYYIGKEGSTCTYCNIHNQEICSNTCTTESLISANMKTLTTKAKNMIDEVVWDTYATDTNGAATAYLQQRGITKKYTGCLNTETRVCTTDGVIRDNEWTGLIGLMSISDKAYANGWLSNGSIYQWSITPISNSSYSNNVWASNSTFGRDGGVNNFSRVWPATYLSYNVQIIGGDGSEGNAYKLSIGEQ